MSFHRDDHTYRRVGALAVAAGAFGAIALSTTPAQANVEVGATAGPHLFSEDNELGVEDRDDATSLRNSVFFGLRLGFGFSDMLGVEAEAGVIPSESRQLVFDVWTLALRAHLIAQFGADKPEKKVIPFVVLGAGALMVTNSDNETIVDKDTDPEFYLGVGLKYRVENGWGLRVDGRAIAAPSSKVTSDGMDSDNAPVLDWELLLSVYKEWGRTEVEKTTEVVDEGPPPTNDADGDGILDDADQCKDEPEDADGFQDEDGCPDADNDGDGVADEADQCKSEPEDKDGFKDDDGCPDTDNDGDGLADGNDKCPTEAEDADSFQDDDGCPDPDNDGDGVADANDQCPDQMETKNGFQDNDGCSDEIPKAVKKFTGVIKGINFKTDSAEILKSSFKTLDAAAKILTDYPDLKMEIQGHTDDVGDAAHNQELSQARAESVKKYFVDKGVAEDRLVAKGYGPDQPLVAKKTKAARAKNRRVEFKLISELDAAPPAPEGGETPPPPANP
jgi:OOP family OmpA-OmpF porin